MDNKVTIDAAYFNHLFIRAVERERLWSDREGLILECEKIAKECDELKAKLATSQNYETVIAAKDREIAAVNEERNRLNAKVKELKEKLEAEQSTNANIGIVYAMRWKDRLAAAERCIEEIAGILEGVEDGALSTDNIKDIIRAYREKETK